MYAESLIFTNDGLTYTDLVFKLELQDFELEDYLLSFELSRKG
jgi:hypothetical protein